MSYVRDFAEQEQQFIMLHRQLYDIAGKAALAKKALMEAYLTLHHPGVPCEITIVHENVLSLDVVFPGLGRSASQQLAQEMRDYLQGLLGEESKS